MPECLSVIKAPRVLAHDIESGEIRAHLVNRASPTGLRAVCNLVLGP